jgi:hypothetical protein
MYKELCDQILAYLAERNANPSRDTWNAKGEDILRKIQRAKEAFACIAISETLH